MTFGEKLQRLRKAAGMSQEQLAAQIEVSRQSVSKWELGESLPDTSKILLMAKIFDVSTDYLLDDTITEQPPASPHTREKSPATFGLMAKLVKQKGHLAGYFVSCYAALALLLSRVAYFMFKSQLTPILDISGYTLAELPMQLRLPLYLINGVSIVAAAAVIAGIVFALVWKKKYKTTA